MHTSKVVKAYTYPTMQIPTQIFNGLKCSLMPHFKLKFNSYLKGIAQFFKIRASSLQHGSRATLKGLVEGMIDES